MYNIILDTNFLLIIPQFKIDIFRELERICNFRYNLSILDKTLDELKGKKYEKLVKEIIKRKKISIIKTNSGGYVDNILKNINDKNVIIATNDKELKKQLKTPLIILKQKKYLQLINFNENI